MNPLTNTKNITKLNEREIALDVKEGASWHKQYKDSAWVFIGGLPYDLTEGDILCVFSQVGEIVNLNLVRDKKTGKQKGFCFLCYEDQRSTVLAVDNLNGIKILGRTVRVDHVANYKMPKERDDDDDLTKSLHAEGCAPKHTPPEEEEEISKQPTPDQSPQIKKEKKMKKPKKEKKKKKKTKKKGRHRQASSPSSGDDSESSGAVVSVKVEKEDPGYDRYDKKEGRTSNRSPSNSDDDRSGLRKKNDSQVMQGSKENVRSDWQSSGDRRNAARKSSESSSSESGRDNRDARSVRSSSESRDRRRNDDRRRGGLNLVSSFAETFHSKERQFRESMSLRRPESSSAYRGRSPLGSGNRDVANYRESRNGRQNEYGHSSARRDDERHGRRGRSSSDDRRRKKRRSTSSSDDRRRKRRSTSSSRDGNGDRRRRRSASPDRSRSPRRDSRSRR